MGGTTLYLFYINMINMDFHDVPMISTDVWGVPIWPRHATVEVRSQGPLRWGQSPSKELRPGAPRGDKGGTTRWTIYEDYGKRWETGGTYKKNTGHTSENIWKILETYGKIIGKQGKYLRNNMKNMGNIWETMENLWETRGKICEKTWENIWTYGPGHPLNPAQWLRPCWDDPWRLNMSCHI